MVFSRGRVQRTVRAKFVSTSRNNFFFFKSCEKRCIFSHLDTNQSVLELSRSYSRRLSIKANLVKWCINDIIPRKREKKKKTSKEIKSFPTSSEGDRAPTACLHVLFIGFSGEDLNTKTRLILWSANSPQRSSGDMLFFFFSIKSDADLSKDLHEPGFCQSSDMWRKTSCSVSVCVCVVEAAESSECVRQYRAAGVKWGKNARQGFFKFKTLVWHMSNR